MKNYICEGGRGEGLTCVDLYSKIWTSFPITINSDNPRAINAILDFNVLSEKKKRS